MKLIEHPQARFSSVSRIDPESRELSDIAAVYSAMVFAYQRGDLQLSRAGFQAPRG